MEKLLFDGWDGVLHTCICAVLSYFTLFFFIRIAGKRTLSKLTAFDFVVSITLGSTLSSMMLGKTPLVEGALVLMLMIALQYLIAFTARKSKTMEKLINSKPVLLFYEGTFLEEEMFREAVTKEEVYAAVRKFRIYNLDEVRAVIMEINGELTVVKGKEGINEVSHSLMDLDLQKIELAQTKKESN